MPKLKTIRGAWSKSVRSADISIDLLRPDDGAVLDAVLAGMSERSRYLRFHAALSHFTDDDRRRLLDVDDRHHVALVARSGSTPVGIARFIRTPHSDADAEMAIAVVDDWQRLGVGRLLTDSLAKRAAALGIERLHGSILSGNKAALAFLRAMFPDRSVLYDRDLVDVVARIGTDQYWEITMDDVLFELLH